MLCRFCGDVPDMRKTDRILSLAGLKTGDIMVGLNGKQVAEMSTFHRKIHQKRRWK
jgi:membrane-associated protease RseP (regulator of RpoE activity)